MNFGTIDYIVKRGTINFRCLKKKMWTLNLTQMKYMRRECDVVR